MSNDSFRPDADANYFLPLGGSGEIGMNLNLYGHDGKWLMVDCGVTFADEKLPGVDIVLPDPTFIERRRGDLVGLVLTHGHEDHIGAVPHLWPRLKCPIWATAFTADLLRHKLAEKGLDREVEINVVKPLERFRAGPFDLEFVRFTHSIPEPNALAVRTPAGLLLHTGDWKLDPNPLVGETTDEATLRALGDEGVTAMVCDSTNALVPGWSGSEGDVRESLTELFGRYENRIAIACFATNVARLESIAVAAEANGRHVALVGRSLWRINEVARENGYLKDIPDFLTEADVGYLSRDKAVLICTGSQGEPRSALARIAADEHPQVALERGDVVIFSARAIPGNEKAIERIENLLARQGVEIVCDDEDHLVHVSGHPNRDELARLYQWVRPRIAIPVHGEYRHQEAHAELARSCQVAQALIPEDGAIIRIARDGAAIVDHAPVGRLALDGPRIVPIDRGAVRGRQRLMHGGAVVATVILDENGRLREAPRLSILGLLDPDQDAEEVRVLIDDVREAVADLSPERRRVDSAVEEVVRIVIRRRFQVTHRRKPVTEIHVIRV